MRLQNPSLVLALLITFSTRWSFLLENFLHLHLGPHSPGRRYGHCYWYPCCLLCISHSLYNPQPSDYKYFLTGIPTRGLPLSSSSLTMRWEFSNSKICSPESLYAQLGASLLSQHHTWLPRLGQSPLPTTLGPEHSWLSSPTDLFQCAIIAPDQYSKALCSIRGRRVLNH